MKDSIPKFLESRMAEFTDHLTMIRKQEYIWKLQIILVLLTLVVQTGFISFPYFGQEKIDLSPDGEYALGSVSPENIISQIEIVYDDPQKTQIERIKAYNSGSYIFERDYIYLTNSVYTVIDEEINNLKVYGSNNIKNIPTLLSKNLRWKYKSKEDLEFLVQFPDKDKLKELIQQCTNLLFSSSCILKENPELLGNMKIYGGKVTNRGIKEKY